MGKPAARVGDPHICPMFDGPKPHVGGPILPPGRITVLIGGLPAATVSSMCVCISPVPDSIVLGSPTVLIGGLPAARLFDTTAHGGSIVFGVPTVLIGEFAAVGAVTVFPGQQHFGNCGVQSSEQIIHQATGQPVAENTLLAAAIAGGYAQDSPKADERGGTGAASRQGLLQSYGVSSTVVQNPTEADLANALKDNKGVIASVEAGTLWGYGRPIGGHAIVITEGDFNEHGELTHVYVNDTGAGQQGRRMTTAEIMQAMEDRKDPKRGISSALNVTDAPIWTQIHP